MAGKDVSEFQDHLEPADFYIIRVCHGGTEDSRWRQHYNDAVAAGKPVGFYAVPQTGDVTGQCHRFHDLCAGLPHTMGAWLDYAVGDLSGMAPSALFVDQWRSVWDCGLYVNMAALNEMGGVYDRFERLWVATGDLTPPSVRWLMWQQGPLDHGQDVDVAANLGGGVRPDWSAFHWPNL